MVSTIDLTLAEAFNGLAVHSYFWRIFTEFGANYLIYFVIGAAVLVVVYQHRLTIRERNYRALALAALSVVLALALGYLLEAMVGRARPYTQDPNIILFGNVAKNSAMPSLHTLIVFAFTFGFYLAATLKKIALRLIYLAVIVGLARIMAGYHYPSDVLVGAAIGVGSAFLVSYEVSPVAKWLAKYESRNTNHESLSRTS